MDVQNPGKSDSSRDPESDSSQDSESDSSQDPVTGQDDEKNREGNIKKNIIYYPRMSREYCRKIVKGKVCSRGRKGLCRLEHKLSADVTNYFGMVSLFYVSQRQEHAAWSRLNSEYIGLYNPMVLIDILQPLADYLIAGYYSNIKFPANLIAPLDVAKFRAYCNEHNTEEVVKLLCATYKSLPNQMMWEMLRTFARYCDDCPMDDALSPWEKLVVWRDQGSAGLPDQKSLKLLLDSAWNSYQYEDYRAVLAEENMRMWPEYKEQTGCSFYLQVDGDERLSKVSFPSFNQPEYRKRGLKRPLGKTEPPKPSKCLKGKPYRYHCMNAVLKVNRGGMKFEPTTYEDPDNSGFMKVEPTFSEAVAVKKEPNLPEDPQ